MTGAQPFWQRFYMTSFILVHHFGPRWSQSTPSLGVGPYEFIEVRFGGQPPGATNRGYLPVWIYTLHFWILSSYTLQVFVSESAVWFRLLVSNRVRIRNFSCRFLCSKSAMCLSQSYFSNQWRELFWVSAFVRMGGFSFRSRGFSFRISSLSFLLLVSESAVLASEGHRFSFRIRGFSFRTRSWPKELRNNMRPKTSLTQSSSQIRSDLPWFPMISYLFSQVWGFAPPLGCCRRARRAQTWRWPWPARRPADDPCILAQKVDQTYGHESILAINFVGMISNNNRQNNG